MIRYFLRSKIHRATVTSTDRDYVGSISIGPNLCRAAQLLEFERVDVYNITNGNRLTTYVIFGGEERIQLNGAAAHLASVGDLIIVAAYAGMEDREIDRHRPTVVHVDERNRPVLPDGEPVPPVRADA
ncbi:MAG TPA: aspartate 1-decarboxylase [Opitutaceae bacterium]|jgi:aspartate 1-decarboxylase